MSLNTRANFMQVVAVIFFIYSVLWATAPFVEINLPARLILDAADWPIDSLSDPLGRDAKWLSAIGAGVLAAMSVLLGGVVAPAIRQGNVSVARMTIIAIIAWYLIDGIGSIAAGVGSNVFFNTIYLVLVLAPLLCIKSGQQD